VYYGIREFLNSEGVLQKAGLTRGIAGKTVVIQGYFYFLILFAIENNNFID
jgi:hypothetical protein